MSDDLPSYVPTSRKEALLAGAALLEQRIRSLRAQAMHQDGNPFNAQHQPLMAALGRLDLVLALRLEQHVRTILREMARAED